MNNQIENIFTKK